MQKQRSARKGMTNTIIAMVGAVIAVFIAFAIITSTWTVTNASIPSVVYVVTNETINFAATNTSYNFANSNVTASTVSVMNATDVLNMGNFTIFSNASSLMLINGAGIKWANYSTGNYLVSYNYQAKQAQTLNAFTNVTTTVWNSVLLLSIGLIVMAAMFILAYFTTGRKND